MARKKLVDKDNKYENTKYWIEYGIDLDSRKIMISEDIDEDAIGWIIRAIHKMVEIDDESAIDVYISSWGGSVADGLALYDTLENLHYLNVRTHAIGKVCSMGFIIYLVGDERFASKRARFLHHEASSVIYGRHSDISDELKELETVEKLCNDIVAEKTSKTNKWWKNRILKKDFWFGKEDAIKFGVVNASNDLD